MDNMKGWKGGVKPAVLAIASDIYGCGFYRVFNPIGMLKQLQLADVIMLYQGAHPIDIFQDQRLQKADIVIGQRIYDKSWLAGIFTQRDRFGFKFLYEIDDSLDTIDQSNPAFKFFRYKNKREVLDIYHNALRYSDAVITTTEYLAKESEQWVNKAYVLPNGIDPSEIFYENIPKSSYTDAIRIGWWAGSSHQDDIMVVLNVLDQMMEKYQNVELFFWGFMPDKNIFHISQQHGLINKSYEYFANFYKKYKSRIIFYPFVETELFHPLLSTFQFDIVIAPLKCSTFDESKSELKLVESGFLKIPVVASPIFPYKKLIKNGINGFIADKTIDWIRYLDLLISNPAKRREIGNNLFNDVSIEYDIRNIALRYIKTFEEIKDRKIDKTNYPKDWWEFWGIKEKQPTKNTLAIHGN